ncbi:MAG: hypothetical protein MJE77_35425 [Proteobacteria bacterium]|nr:hypothetical protein [Pseudomonadota bacterium]
MTKHLSDMGAGPVVLTKNLTGMGVWAACASMVPMDADRQGESPLEFYRRLVALGSDTMPVSWFPG